MASAVNQRRCILASKGTGLQLIKSIGGGGGVTGYRVFEEEVCESPSSHPVVCRDQSCSPSDVSENFPQFFQDVLPPVIKRFKKIHFVQNYSTTAMIPQPASLERSCRDLLIAVWILVKSKLEKSSNHPRSCALCAITADPIISTWRLIFGVPSLRGQCSSFRARSTALYVPTTVV